MSWQESYRRTYQCDCGQGEVTLIGESDDWNRTRETENINCAYCSDKIRHLAKQESKDRQSRDQRIESLDAEIKSIIKTIYMDGWYSFANKFKNKKVVHEFIMQKKLEHISISSYYQHNKRNSLTDCVNNLLKPANYKEIIGLICVPNENLNGLIEEVDSLYRQKRGERINEMYREYHGR